MVLNLCTLFMDVSVKMIKLKKGAHINKTLELLWIILF